MGGAESSVPVCGKKRGEEGRGFSFLFSFLPLNLPMLQASFALIDRRPGGGRAAAAVAVAASETPKKAHSHPPW